MTTKAWLGIVCMVGAVAACGNDGGGAGGAGGNGGQGSTTSTTGTGTAATVNGCDPSMAEDHTMENPAMITFGGSLGEKYSPSCIKVAKGSGVMFMGDFSAHPLAGGADGKMDGTSPIKETKTGMMVEFDNLASGTYGFFCEFHDAVGMHGAIVVE